MMNTATKQPVKVYDAKYDDINYELVHAQLRKRRLLRQHRSPKLMWAIRHTPYTVHK